MPIERRGKLIYHRVGGKWKVKQHCTSVDSAKGAFRLLKGLESGSIKREDVGKQRKGHA